MSTPTLYPGNTFNYVATLRTAKIVSGILREVPLEEGPVSGFFATSSSPTATEADPRLRVSGTYTGFGGKWAFAVPPTVDAETLIGLFSDTPPVFIIEQPGNLRAYVQCAFAPSRPIQSA